MNDFLLISKTRSFFNSHKAKLGPRIAFIAMAALLISSSPRAEIIEASDNQFKIVSRSHVDALPKTVYQQFLQAGEWWNPEHTWFGKDSSLSIDPKAGGCFCEINGDSEVEHMRVVFVQPNVEVRLEGALGPLQMMGLRGVMSWRFLPSDAGGTTIEQTYIVSGNVEGGLESFATVVDDVQTDQLKRLSQRLEAP